MKPGDSVRPSQQRWHVVVVDDNPDDRAEVRRLLLSGSERVYDFTEYETAAQFLGAVLVDERGLPDCVVLDYHLPDADALQVLEGLRGVGRGIVFPVVVVTGQDGDEIGRAVLRAGAQDFIGKSWMTPQSLTRALQNAKDRWALAREVRLGETRLRGLADAVPQPVWMLDAVGRAVHVNRRWLECFGPLPNEQDDVWLQLLHPDDVERVLSKREAASVRGEPYQFEARLRRLDGAYRWCQVNAAPTHDVSGAVSRWYGVSTDVHEVRENDARLRLALEASKTGIWTWDLSTDAVEWTDECYQIHGVDPGTFGGSGAAFFSLVHPDDRGAVEREVRSAIANRSLYRLDFRILQPDGASKWVQNLGRASYDEAGTPLRMLGTITDISDRKLAEAALALREHQLQMLADNTPDIIARFDPDLRHVFVNAAVEKATGIPPREFLGKTHQELRMPAELCQRWDDALRSVFATGRQCELEFDASRGSQSRTYLSRLVPETDASGNVAFVLGIVSDITERKLAENRLRASEERLERAQRVAQTGTWDWNVVTGESTWTEQAWLLFGCEPFSAEVSFELWLSCIHSEDREKAAQRVQEAMARGSDYRDEFRIRHAGGRVSLLETVGEVVRDEAGKVVRLVGTVRDVTERRQAELALQRALDESRRAVNAREKLASLVSHDLKTPLNALHLGIGLLEREAGANVQTLARMKRQAGRMDRIIDELLDVAQLHAGTPLQLVLQDTELLGLLRTLIAEHQERCPKHAIVLSASAETIVVRWDVKRLERVVSNLLGNATKYSPSGGSVEVRVELTGAGGSECVALKVADQGIGIAPNEQATVFDWYARAENAKRTSIQGTGIGLAGVKDIVLQHGGSISVESSLGHGSVFTVTLPTRPRPAVQEARSSPRAAEEPERISATRQPS